MLWQTRSDREQHVETFTEDASWRLELDEFFAAARGAARLRVGSTAEALEIMLLVEAIYASAGIGRWSSSNIS